MKTTKHLKSLAYNIANSETKEHLKFYREHLPHAYDREKKPEQQDAYFHSSYNYILQELTRIKKALYKGNFYMRVDSVSKSGMSRKIKFAYTYKNKIITIRNKHILKMACCDPNGKISGCGMDMLFHAQYTLFNNLHSSYKKANYSKNMKQYLNY